MERVDGQMGMALFYGLTQELHHSILHVNAMPLLRVGYKPVLARRTNGPAELFTRELHAEHKVIGRSMFEH